MTQQEFNRRLTLTLMQATLLFQACAFNQPITFEKALKPFNRSLVELQEALQQMEDQEMGQAIGNDTDAAKALEQVEAAKNPSDCCCEGCVADAPASPEPTKGD